jgi:hypothetical protein
MLKVIKDSIIWGVIYAACYAVGYGIAWLILDGPQKLQDFKNRKYVEIELGNDDGGFDF